MATPQAAINTGELRLSDALAIVSTMLQDFYDGSRADTIATSGKILSTLLQNAMKETDDPKQLQMYRRVRLTNPKIKQHIVRVPGALDLLGIAGFEEKGEYLQYSPHTRNAFELYLQEGAPSQEKAVIQAICEGLEAKLKELELETKDEKNKSSSNTTDSNSTATPFLSEEERLRRVEKIKAMKKAKEAERKVIKQHWQENLEDRKEAERRREALLNLKAEEAAKEGLAANINIKSSKAAKLTTGILPKPFEDPLATANAPAISADDLQALRRRLVQETMKDPNVTPKEKQCKVQELIRAGPEALLAAAKAVVSAPIAENEIMESDSPAKVDDKMEHDDESDDKKPAAKMTPPVSNSTLSEDLIWARRPSPPSADWTRFVEQTPRCQAAEGIRDSSVFYHSKKHASSDLAVPQCLKRLFKELDGLKDALPADPNCSIWLRFDEETPQYIRALVAAPLPGPTPYSGGLFAFDIHVPNDYPHSNPSVQLLTTGGGKVRFGPNLYADGKVCLSLLGTWPGPKWNPKHSSLYQLLISIQGLLLGVEHPYYLEPGHGGWEGKIKEGDFQIKGQTLSGQSLQLERGVPQDVIQYEDVLRVGTAKYAIHQPLMWSLEGSANKNGLEAFNEIIQAHFCENTAAILAEIRTWMSDHALGRNRSVPPAHANVKTMALPIDELQKVLPKLETLLTKASMPKYRTAGTLKSAPTTSALAEEAMETEEDSKPRAPSPAAKRDKENLGTRAKRNKKEPPAATSSGIDVVEQKRQQMQEAANNGDYVRAGRLQEEVKRLEELQKGMLEAAQQNDFIRAGRLQAQFKALTATDISKSAAGGRHVKQSDSAWNDDEDDEEMDDENEEEVDDEDDEEMDDGEGPPPFAGPGPAIAFNNKSRHPWGTGSQLGNSASAQESAPAVVTIAPAKKDSPKKSIPPEQLCRLRIRLPNNTSVVEDFEKYDSLSAVYRRLEGLMSVDDKKLSAVAGPVVGGGAFSQPISSAGFTLLLTRPKREFSLEMHGTKSLEDLNLAPSATLTVMRCIDRGIMYRGEVENRIRGAQGDAMDVEGLTYEGLVELTERVGKAAPKDGGSFLTLTAEQFEANTEKFTPSTYIAGLKESMEEVEEGDLRCPICLGCYDEADTTPSMRRILGCGHVMHTGCLETWLRTNSSCPLCKTSI